MRFRDWPARRLVLLSLAWVVLSVGAFVWRISKELDKFAARSGSEIGAVAVSGGIAEIVVLLFGPPLLLLALWLAMKRFARP